MAPMQWRSATADGDSNGVRASVFEAAGQEPDVRQGFGVVSGTATLLPVGLDLPCTEDPELFR